MARQVPVLGISSCVHFFDGQLDGNGLLLDAIDGKRAAPTTGNEFLSDADEGSVICTGSTGSPVVLLDSGQWRELPDGKDVLVVYAGYVDETQGAPNGTTRVAIGDANNALGLGEAGFGLVNDHQALNGTTKTYVWQTPSGVGVNECTCANTGGGTSNLTTLVTAATGGTYFCHYAVYRTNPADNPTSSTNPVSLPTPAYGTVTQATRIMESAVLNYLTGADILRYGLRKLPLTVDTPVPPEPWHNAMNIGGAQFIPAFRTAGVRLTGHAMFYFNALPSDYKTGVQWMANRWKLKKKELPYWWKGLYSP